MPSSRKIHSTVMAVLLTAAAAGVSEAQQPGRSAPTPTDWAALAKLPDFTGVWEIGFGPPPGGRGAAAGGGAAGRGGRGGARAGGPPAGPQLTPAYAEKRQARLANPPEDSQAANCLPPGMPGIMGQPYPMEFLLTPGLVTIVIEAYTQVRHIYTDGRPLPEDPDPRFHGTSIGRWDGDTLVVETVGFSPQTDLAGNTPHSDKMKIVERFKLADPDTMTIETTVTDPEALSAPWVSNRTLRRHRAWTIAEYICEENNRNSVDANGKAGINIKK
jgi:hypothetical protein